MEIEFNIKGQIVQDLSQALQDYTACLEEALTELAETSQHPVTSQEKLDRLKGEVEFLKLKASGHDLPTGIMTEEAFQKAYHNFAAPSLEVAKLFADRIKLNTGESIGTIEFGGLGFALVPERTKEFLTNKIPDFLNVEKQAGPFQIEMEYLPEVSVNACYIRMKSSTILKDEAAQWKLVARNRVARILERLQPADLPPRNNRVHISLDARFPFRKGQKSDGSNFLKLFEDAVAEELGIDDNNFITGVQSVSHKKENGQGTLVYTIHWNVG